MQVHVKRVSNLGFRLGGVYLFRLGVASDGRNSEECQALAPRQCTKAGLPPREVHPLSGLERGTGRRDWSYYIEH